MSTEIAPASGLDPDLLPRLDDDDEEFMPEHSGKPKAVKTTKPTKGAKRNQQPKPAVAENNRAPD